MKAIQFDDFGGPEVLHLADMPDPELRPTDLIVRVHAAGVNRADLTHRRGGYGRPNFGDSTIMGLEIAGEVIAVGAETVGYAVGDRVMGIVGGGAYAELARIDYRMAMPVPPALDFVHAAAVPEVFVTAHEALIHLGRLQGDERVLIHAGAGGVGSAAIQLAHVEGATIFTTVDASKFDVVHRLGADHAIDYHTEDFAKVIAEKTLGRGVHVVIDFIGASYFERNLASLTEGGRLIQVGIMGGASGAHIPLDRVLYGHLQILGTVMKSRSQDEKRAMVRRFRERWLGQFAHGQLQPLIDRTFPLAQAADAHRRMESGQATGKIVLTMLEAQS